MNENKKNIPLGVILTIVPVVVFFVGNLIVSSIVQIFYVTPIIIQAQADGVPLEIMTDQTWLTEQLFNTSYLGVATLLADLLVALGVFFWWRAARGKEVPVKKALNCKKLGFLVLVGLAIQGCLSIVFDIAFRILPESVGESYGDLANGLLGGESTSLTLALAVVIGAPLAEDLVVRGLALNYGRKYMGTTAAIVASSITFGLMHLTNLQMASLPGVMVQVIYAAAIGAVFAILVVRFKSVWAGVFAHFIMNGSGQLLSVVSNNVSHPESVSYIVWAIGLLALAGVIVMLKTGQVPVTEGETYEEIKAAKLAATVGENTEA